MKKVLVLLVMVLAFSLSQAQIGSPLKEGVYNLKGIKAIGVDISSTKGDLLIFEGGIQFSSSVFLKDKYSVFFVGEYENAEYKTQAGGSKAVEGLGYINGRDKDGTVIVSIGANNDYIILTTDSGSYSFLIN